MISRDTALQLLDSNIKSPNLKKHCYAVEAVMISLAKYFRQDEEVWGLSGLVHDIDYEKYPDRHPLEGIKILEEENYPKEVIDTVAAHAWGYRENMPKPKNEMEWSLYSCDELTGLIVACALVRPERKIDSLTVDSVLKKWNQKSFAAGANREQIENCEKELGIKLSDFIQIALDAMKSISDDLEL